MATGSTQELSLWVRLNREWRFGELLEHWAWRLRGFVGLAIVAFYVLSFNGLWRFTPDSGLYLSIARSIARGEGYLYHGEAHRMAYPGLPYLLAGLMRVSEKHAIALADGVMLVCALVALALCYRLFRLVVRPGAAVVVTVFTAVNCVVYEHAFMVLSDMPFFLGSMMVLTGGALCGTLPAPALHPEVQPATPRERTLGFVLMPLGLLLCAVMRPTFYVLAACVLCASLLAALRMRQKRYFLGALALAAGLALLYLAVASVDPRRAHSARDIYEEAVSHHLVAAVDGWHVLENGWALVSPEIPFGFFAFSWGKVGNAIIVAILLVAAWWVLRRWPMALLWFFATLAMQLIVIPVPRYLLPIVPLLALAWWEAASRLAGRSHWRVANTLTIAAFCLMVPSAVRCMGSTWPEQYRRPFAQAYHHGQFEAVSEAAALVKKHVPKDAVVIVPDRTASIMTYLTDRIAIDLNEPSIERFRRREMWVVLTRYGPMRNELLDRGFRMDPLVEATYAEHRKVGVLALRKGHWPAKAAF